MPFEDFSEFAGLVSDIYDCALDDARWPAVLERICRKLGGEYVTLSMSTADHPAWTARHASPWDREALEELAKFYGPDIPGLEPLMRSPTDMPISTLSQIPEETARQTSFYTEWALPHGLRDGGVVKFIHTAGIMGIMSFTTGLHRDPISQRERRIMAYLSPHIRRAVAIGEALDRKAVPASAYRPALDALTLPILMTDGQSRMRFINSAADHLLSTGTVLTARGRTVEPVGELAQAAFAEAVACAAADDALLGRRGVGLRLTGRRDEAVYAYILPIGRSRARTFGGAGAAIFITASARHRPPPVAVLMTMLDLGPDEARILLHMGAGATIEETAEALGMTPANVHNGALGLLVKLGCETYAEFACVLKPFAFPEAIDPANPGFR